ncbi:hypothetical protein CHISP_3260 [Chitinispirillum alkaliphilum]|nr:hypothetical protein CHISP_3260 [Chitinispirillum alkaliphilum]
MLIVNADDWGSSEETTNTIKECLDYKIIDTVSAMVFMKDSHRAADMALQEGTKTALHVNFTTPFDGDVHSVRLKEAQLRLIKYLRSSKLAQLVYNPLLTRDFEYVFNSQCEEFTKLYGTVPNRIDGHNHMHLCANMIFGDLLPRNIRVRRNITVRRGEKGMANRFYRSFLDKILEKRYICTHFFYHIQQISKNGKEKRAELLCMLEDQAQVKFIELLAHPQQKIDYDYLLSKEFMDAAFRIPRGDFSGCQQSRQILK